MAHQRDRGASPPARSRLRREGNPQVGRSRERGDEGVSDATEGAEGREPAEARLDLVANDLLLADRGRDAA